MTTLSPTNKNARVTLSGGNDTCTASTTGGSIYESGYATSSVGAGAKKYFEATCNATQPFENIAIGWCTTDLTLADGGFLGETFGGAAPPDSIGWWDSNNVYLNGSVAYAATTYAPGDVVSLALDTNPATPNCWFRTGGGNWNNSALADPATGAGGFAFTGIILPVFPAYTVFDGNTTAGSWTFNFSSSTVRAPPSGFSVFDSAADSLMGQIIMRRFVGRGRLAVPDRRLLVPRRGIVVPPASFLARGGPTCHVH